MLWVFFPLYAIKVAYDDMANAYQIRNKVVVATTLRSKEGKKAV
jgi:Flp pilus assembly protein protease CpaA